MCNYLFLACLHEKGQFLKNDSLYIASLPGCSCLQFLQYAKIEEEGLGERVTCIYDVRKT